MTAVGAVRAETYEQLTKALDGRRRQLGMTMLELDDKSGMQDGYSAKLFCHRRHLGPLSLPLMLQTLGVELLLVMREPTADQMHERTGSAHQAGLIERRALPKTGEA